MKTKIIIGIITLLLLSFTATAQEFNLKETLDTLELEQITEELNKNIDKIPQVIRNNFANERINIEMTMNDQTTEILSIETKDGKLETIKRELTENPTYKVTTTEQVINNIINSPDPRTEALKAYKNKDIKVEAVTIINKIKMFFANIFIGFIK